MFKQIVVTIVLAVLTTGSFSCANGTKQSSTGTGLTSESFRAELLAWDFSEQVSSAKLLPDTGLRKPGTEASLTDKMLLGSLEMDGRQVWDPLYTTISASKAYLSRNSWPRTGVDLFPELLTEAGVKKFKEMSPVERYKTYALGINPATGRFYSSFDSKDWSMGGIYIRSIGPDERRQEIVSKGEVVAVVNLGGDIAPTDPLFEYTLFGDTEGEVLYTDHLTPGPKKAQ